MEKKTKTNWFDLIYIYIYIYIIYYIYILSLENNMIREDKEKKNTLTVDVS